MPNFFMVTDKLGVDPFNERFPMDWVQEGTVRAPVGYISSTMTRPPEFPDSTPLETSPHGIASSAQPPERVAPTCRGPLRPAPGRDEQPRPSPIAEERQTYPTLDRQERSV